MFVNRVKRKVVINIMLFILAVIASYVYPDETMNGSRDLLAPIVASIIYCFFNIVILQIATRNDMTEDKFKTNFIILQHFFMLAILLIINCIVSIAQSEHIFFIMPDKQIEKATDYLLIVIVVTLFFRTRKDILRFIMGFK